MAGAKPLHIYVEKTREKIIHDSKLSRRKIHPTSPAEVFNAGPRISTRDLCKQTSQLSLDSDVSLGDSGIFSLHSFDGSDHNISGNQPSLCQDELDSITLGKSYPFLLGTKVLFRLTSVPNPVPPGDIYHVITFVDEQVASHLRKYDRVVHFNDEDIKDKDGEYVQKLLSDCETDDVTRNKLSIWRWSEENDDSLIKEIEIVLHHLDEDGHEQQRISYLQSLNNVRTERKVFNLKWKSDPKLYYVRIDCEQGNYIFADVDNMALEGAPIMDKDRPIEQFRFLIRTFQCMTMGPEHKLVARYGVVMSYEHEGHMYDVSSNIQAFSNSINIKPQTEFSTTNPDERFFILYEVLGGDEVFESLLYENMCIQFDRDLGQLRVKELGMSKPKSKRSFITPRPRFIFQSYSMKEIKEIIAVHPDTIFTGETDITCDCLGLPHKKKSILCKAKRSQEYRSGHCGKEKCFEFGLVRAEPDDGQL